MDQTVHHGRDAIFSFYVVGILLEELLEVRHGMLEIVRREAPHVHGNRKVLVDAFIFARLLVFENHVVALALHFVVLDHGSQVVLGILVADAAGNVPPANLR